MEVAQAEKEKTELLQNWEKSLGILLECVSSAAERSDTLGKMLDAKALRKRLLADIETNVDRYRNDLVRAEAAAMEFEVHLPANCEFSIFECVNSGDDGAQGDSRNSV